MYIWLYIVYIKKTTVNFFEVFCFMLKVHHDAKPIVSAPDRSQPNFPQGQVGAV